MNSTFQPLNQRRFIRVSAALSLLVGLLWVSGLRAQTPDEHASHHPGQGGGAMPAAGGSPAPGGMGPPAGVGPPGSAGGMGGMMEGMGEMMKAMGAPKPKDFYPTLMDLPDLPLAKRLEVEQQAGERMHSGVALMNESLDYLLQAASAQDYTAMQAGTASLREGLARFESGLAAQRALAEGKAPRNVALTWFKRDMNLLPLPGADAEHSGLGVFHWFVMALLVGFFVVMSGMYFFKMRRASALLQRIADGGPVNSIAAAAAKKPAAAQKPAAPPEKSAPAADKPAAAAEKPGAADKLAAASDKPAPAASPKAAAPAATTPPAAAAPAGPVSSGWKGILRVNRIFDETPGVKTFRFTAMDGGPIPFTYLPGQYLNVMPMIDGKRTPRSYTMASSPTQRHHCELTIKREEEGKGVSKYLHDGLQEGELLEASGPTGIFTFTGAEAKSIVLIGGGVGITPLMSYVRYLTDSGWPGEIFFLYTCRHVSDFIFRPELERLCARHPKLHLVVTITRPNEEPWSGLTGHLTKELIAHHVPDIATRRVHVCGPDKMMKAVQGALLELDVPAAQVKTEAFSAPQNGSAEGGKKPSEAAAKPPAEGDTKAPVGGAAKAPPEAAAKPPAAAAEKTPANADAKAPDEASGNGAAAAGAVAVTFQKSGKAAPLPPDKSVLEASEDVGVNIDFECRIGTCGKCKTPLLSGAVTMEVEDALSADEKAGGVILACQAKATADCAVDA